MLNVYTLIVYIMFSVVPCIYVVCVPSDDYVTGCLLTRGGQQNVGHAPDG